MKYNFSGFTSKANEALAAAGDLLKAQIGG